jgi:acyl carrier protein
MQVQNSNYKLDEQATEVSSLEAVQNWLVQQLAEQLSLDPKAVNASEPLTRYGLDSIDAVTMVGDLEDWLDLELPSTLFWDYPTIEKSASYLVENFDVSKALGSAEAAKSTSENEDGWSSNGRTKESDDEDGWSSNGRNKKGWGGLFGRKK